MGTMTMAQFANQMRDAPEVLRTQERAGVNQSALAITNTLRDYIRAASGGDMRLSGVGRRGAKVGARFDVKGTTNPTALIRATGPLHLVEGNTSAHRIPREGRRRRGRARVVVVNGHPYAYVNHPGTWGKRPWARGSAVGIPKGIRAWSDVMSGFWLKVLR